MKKVTEVDPKGVKKEPFDYTTKTQRWNYVILHRYQDSKVKDSKVKASFSMLSKYNLLNLTALFTVIGDLVPSSQDPILG